MKKIVISTLLATTLLLSNSSANNSSINSTSKIVESYEKLASQGEIEAMFNLGLIYLTGDGANQDYTKAKEWFLKVAKQRKILIKLLNIGQSHQSKVLKLQKIVWKNYAKRVRIVVKNSIF